MTQHMLGQSLRAFNASIASDSFTPGGGCVSALAGAMGAGLARMVLTLTIGKKKYAEFDAENQALVSKLEITHQELLECVERDAAGCARITEAMVMPKDTEPEKILRKGAMSEASKVANEAPIDVCNHALALLRIFKGSLNKVNRNCITDWACGALQAYAALEGAAMNAKINTGSITDPAYNKNLHEKLRTMLGDGRMLVEEIRSHVHSSLDATN
ncbi:MAG: cyclodeaminase/cyclohydrolase family protein [Candidatus Riflebacteria bacterium]|nr:cyclodeaminase/cyclohydrolase family protein [Candidatus Riflebacteria bacterium]